jgi:DNA-binding LacI/PurR family transcriptional regulator
VVVVTPIDANPTYFAEIRAVIREKLRADGNAFVQETTGGDRGMELETIERAIAERASGVILVSPWCLPDGAERLLHAHVPTVVVTAATSRTDHAPKGVARVRIDNSTGIREAIAHLISHGHERIAYIRGPSSSLSDEERFSTFSAALAEHHVNLDEHYVHHPRDPSARFAAGALACKHLLGLRQPPTAILAYSDAMAMGCLAAAAELKVGVPTDLSVIGHDDLAFSAYTVPALSTIVIERSRLGAYAAAALLEMIGGGPASERSLETYLEVRASSGLRL